MNYCSLRWDNGVLVALDQRELPNQIRFLRITTVDQLIDAVRTLAIRGASALGIAGAFGVALAAYAHTNTDGVDIEHVTRDANRIATARPTAINLAWGVHRALAKLPTGCKAVVGEALEMLAEDALVNHVAADHAADLLVRVCPDRPLRVLTHCNTGWLATAAIGTALGAIRVLASRGKIHSVLVGETRPLLQGARLTAWELAEANIPHRLAVDSAAAWAMASGEVDCVVVGADRIAVNGDVANKVGTYALALAAHRHRIPFVVVAPESTRDPHTGSGRDIVVEERPACEVTGFAGVMTAPPGTDAFNPAFDVTPAALVTAVVTERGVLSNELTEPGA
jgi:methylthioribose-1-phosphate isomerase